MFSFAALRLLAAAVVSTSPTPSPAPSAIPQIAHVITSDRSDETLHNAVRTTYVVTAADIARNGYRTVGDALANVPGVEIESYGPIGAAAAYGIRGSSSTQTLVLIDGEPAPGGLANSVPLGTISTAGVARIEVVEGGGSTLYGTGAIGGIINIITDGSKAPSSASLRYGTFDDGELRVQADGLSFEHINANNSFAVPPSNSQGIPNPATRSNSDYTESDVRYGTDRTLGRFDVSLRASAADDDLGADGYFPYVSPTGREHDVNEGGVLGIALRRAQSDATLSLFGTRQLLSFDCEAATDVNCYQLAPSLDAEARTGLSLRDSVSGAHERLIYGADLSRGTVFVSDGNGDPVAQDTFAQSAAYAQETWIGTRSEVYAGIRGERDGSLGGEFSPSLGARYDLSAALMLKVNAASAFRAPNATELYYPGYGSVTQGLGLLRPERAHVADATLIDDRVLGGVSLGWFANYTRNLIEPAIVGYQNNVPTYAPQNIDHAHIEGLTFDAKTVPFHGVSTTLGVTDLYLASNVDTGARLPDNAVLAANLGLVYRGGATERIEAAGISERVVGARGFVDPTQPLFDQPADYG
ncbi:MAG TPA: TonB-dependent receptor, partial [Candidatus Aquilonibacter sp.]